MGNPYVPWLDTINYFLEHDAKRYNLGGGYWALQLPPSASSSGGGPAGPPAIPEALNQAVGVWGKVIPISMGMRRMSPQVIWLKAPVSVGVTKLADFAVSWGYNADDVPEDTVVTALYADATLIWTAGAGALLPGGWGVTFYPGSETQMPDPTMLAANGALETPAYRNQIYAVFTNFPLEQFGYKLPGISAEISGSGGEAPRSDTWSTTDKHPLVVLEDEFTISKHSPPGDFSAAVYSATSIRSRTSHRRGQYYLELRLDAHWTGAWSGFAGAVGVGGGFVLATSSLTQTPGNMDDTVGAAMPLPGTSAELTKRLWSGHGYRVEGPDAWSPGQTLGLHINMNEGYARARNVSSGGVWTAPCYYAAPGKVSFVEIEIGDPIYVQASVALAPETYLIGYSDKQTVNFGGKPFLGEIPAGATAWNGDGGAGTTLGTLPLRDFISKISTYCGLVPEVDLSFEGIDDVIHGGLITRDTTFADFLQVLGRAYGFDYFEGEQIRIVRRVVGSTYTIDKVIPREDLIMEGDRSIQTTRHRDDSPTEIELSYIDVTQQFRWNIQRGRRILFPVKTTQSKRKDAFAIPIITTATDALTMASRAMFRDAMQNVDHDGSFLPKHMDIEPSDILTITAGDTEYTVKVMSVTMNADGRIAFNAVNLLTDEDMTFEADAGSPNLPYQGNRYLLDVTEGADRFFGTQQTGILIGIEGADGFTGALVPPPTVVMAATEGADIFAGVVSLTDPTLVLDLDFTTM